MLEEDTGEELEIVITKALFEAYGLKDDLKHTASKVLGEQVSLDMVCGLLEKLGWVEDIPESKKHLNYKVLNL